MLILIGESIMQNRCRVEVIDETLEEDAENKKKKKHTIYIREQMNDVVELILI